MSTGISDIAARLRQVRVEPRPELRVTRHLMGGKPQYVITDPTSLQSHKFGADDYQLIVALSDKRTLQEVFQQFVAAGTLKLDDEEQFFRFILYLHQIGLLNLPLADGRTLYRRFQRRNAKSWTGRFMNMLFLRVPLVQPDRFLDRTHRWVRPLFTRTALLIWCLSMLVSGFCVWSQWDRFKQPLPGLFDLQNLPALWLLLIGLKVFHELGHAYACRVFGGSVPEIGAYFILLTPCAYVDASSSWGFANRWHRMVVALAGMYIESIIAMVALMIWCFQPDTWLAGFAHEAIVLTTIVTIGFNANPLMRYDGYFVLSDLLNRPNLRGESQGVFYAAMKRLLFGIVGPSETLPWRTFLLYCSFGAASVIYQQLVVVGICVTLLTRIPLVGLLFGGCFAAISLGGQLVQYIRYVLASEELSDRRLKAGLVTVTILACIGLAGVLPMPIQYTSEGTLIRADDQTLRAKSPGFLRKVSVVHGQNVSAGDVICELDNAEIPALIAETEGTLLELRSSLPHESNHNRALATQTQRRIEQHKYELADLVSQQRELQVTSPWDGPVALEASLDHLGKFVRVGEPVAIVSSGDWVVQLLLSEEELLGRLVQIGAAAQVRLLGFPHQQCSGRVTRVASFHVDATNQASQTPDTAMHDG
ncbi:MAG: HlyD family efflux transporter periplasmic adaptor subunit, partial [Planctomycetota bacterium]|nr:HlyD family efflux transporter periplasmic adaptor subunit [Planctomycetota bacterium]